MELDKVPILDCSDIAGPLEEVQDKPGFDSFTEKLGAAMSGIGFVYLVNHGVNPDTVENLYSISREFFELPQEVKSKYKKEDAVEVFQGYQGPEDEILTEDENRGGGTDQKECWDYWGLEALDEKNFPSETPGFKSAFDACREPMIELSKKLFRAFAAYLKLDDPEFFIKRHRALDDQRIRTQTVFRSNYYMAMEPGKTFPEDSMRLTEHMDWGTITFLFQDSTGGLEAKNTNGEWISVTPVKNALILNAGLMLEMWSGGHFPATPHRVRLVPELACQLRQSLAYFIQPDGDSNCIPVVPEKPTWNPSYPKVDKETHYEYFQARVRATRAY